ncbi:pyridoxamine 5'-phosphate oxidase family protein [Calidifontibacillus erzurumensis]|uniref:Pyridoxamine 5'-phosphate oxidase family protein n=1 Tax=Calidifontibacillus erzurumensis TaxID=2741433 RepID=A0A8J8GBG9_9BACI|nr:pyridoxamine 5'-phosphate oxidase family protein [Calidifontibacillus erzurumensis]NSL50734.1 pyridoxamine 5'-phosphate oxidase family protein [Calidifontibacillus erzurumensis]
MAQQVEQQLTSELLGILQKERYATIATVDFETGGPNVNAISWVYAPGPEKIYFAVDNRSRIVQNIKNNPKVVLTTIAFGTTFSISGDANVKVEKLEGVPLKLALIEIKIHEVRDVMFYGSKISADVSYEKTYDKEAAEKLDRQVMEAMKKA